MKYLIVHLMKVGQMNFKNMHTLDGDTNILLYHIKETFSESLDIQ